MKLSTDSWHYRNFEAWQHRSRSQRHRALRHGTRQPDLCTYMRIALIWGPLRRFWSLFDKYSEEVKILTGMFLLLYAVGVVIGFGIGLSSLWYTLLIFPVGYIAILMLGVLLGYVIAWPIKKLLDRRKNSTGPGVVKEYIKARKRRVCPIIEFETD